MLEYPGRMQVNRSDWVFRAVLPLDFLSRFMRLYVSSTYSEKEKYGLPNIRQVNTVLSNDQAVGTPVKFQQGLTESALIGTLTPIGGASAISVHLRG